MWAIIEKFRILFVAFLAVVSCTSSILPYFPSVAGFVRENIFVGRPLLNTPQGIVVGEEV